MADAALVGSLVNWFAGNTKPANTSFVVNAKLQAVALSEIRLRNLPRILAAGCDFRQSEIKRVEIKADVAYLTGMIQRLSAITGWLALAFIVVVTLSPIGTRPAVASPHLEHFAAFAVTGFALALAYPNRALLVVAIVVGAAFGLEALQLLTPDRHGRAVDALAKALGGISGISIGQMASFLLRLKPVQSDRAV